MKLWDISEVDFDNQKTENFFLEKYFIIAHRATINTITVIQEKQFKEAGGRFIVSAGQDNNINMFILETGVFIGSFGTHKWNIHDLSAYKNKRPRYVREWYLKLRARMKKIVAK